MEKETSRPRVLSPVRETDYWIRFAWIWSLVFLVSLIVPVVISLLNPATARGERPIIIGLALASAAWHIFWVYIVLRRIGNPGEKPGLMATYLVGVFVVWYFLTEIDPVFYIHLSGAYAQIYIFLPPAWAISATVIVSLVLFGQQIDGDLSRLNLQASLFWLLVTGMGIVFYLWIRGIIIQSERRKELIQQLAETQTELAASERRAGILSERQRLAQEIHDTLAQGFTSIVMHLEAAEQLLPADYQNEADGSPHRHIDQARRTARDSLEQARRLVWELRPQSLEDASLPEAVKRAARRWAKETGISCEVEVTGQIAALHPQIEIALLRASQEAMNNVRKHARAQAVNLTLSYFDDLIVLDVKDDGRGFVPEAEPAGGPERTGYGLTAMRERVEKLNGKLLVESAPGEGSALVIEIPLGGQV